MTKTEMTPSAKDNDSLLEEAADWLVRLISGGATQTDVDALGEWRAQSPAHDAAFREVAGVSAYAQAGSTTTRPTNRRAFISACAGGAGVLLVGASVLRPPFNLWPSFDELSAEHRTPVGGRLDLNPARGVEVQLASRTAASVSRSGSGLRLVSGEAFVGVHEAVRAFQVDTRQVRIEALDADFNVQAFPSRDRVTCARGQMTCVIQSRAYHLKQDEDITVEADGQVRLSRIEAAKVAAWRTGRLIFEGVALSEVVDQINLYRPGRIILRDPELGRTPLNAVFHIAQIDNAVVQIEQLLNLKARAVGGGVVIIG